ncbi:MAG: succinylglutamate desuccinylase/aspartoacylase family protein [Nitrospirae bacterium]|nr:succinylglutamate desuccinylase/aspartoacylase family protein [Nitrospirota bacterium]MDA1305122.1 succinylglutamate desuccinylase/aspartoacylase family protein [Nitrospirota bacterium]
MKHYTNGLRIWDNPQTEEVGDTVEEFLRLLGGPTWLNIPGKDPTRSRAIVTLLHGNEPSGVRAIHRWLQIGIKPQVNIAGVIGAIDAALAPPGFAFRTLPGRKDLNRCFREPYDSPEGQVAKEVLQRLAHLKPEALIDLHNTSGQSPCYTITTKMGDKQKALTSIFSNQLVITDLRLGSLMEATETEIPTIAVECGGNRDPQSDRIAFDGLTRFTQTDSLFPSGTSQPNVQIFEHPIRVELRAGMTVAYATTPVDEADCTLRFDADKLNFDMLHPGEPIGWIGPHQLDTFLARDAKGNNRVQELFTVVNGELHIAQTGRILMMTTDPMMASSDCLFYFLPCADR